MFGSARERGENDRGGDQRRSQTIGRAAAESDTVHGGILKVSGQDDPPRRLVGVGEHTTGSREAKIFSSARRLANRRAAAARRAPLRRNLRLTRKMEWWRDSTV